jgi:L-fuculose-phosphate aldolase
MESTSQVGETTDARRIDVAALEPRAQVALLARVLHAEGYNDHNLGHITYRLDDGTFLVDPWELAWSEVRASDVLRMDARGQQLEGTWSITPAIPLHLAVHDVRPDIRWVLHNHPRWVAVAAAQQRLPAPYDQMACYVDDDDVAIFSDYDGTVAAETIAIANAMALGERNLAILANHGVLVVGQTMRLAYQRAALLAWRCRLGWMVEAVGGAHPVPRDVARGLADSSTKQGGISHMLEMMIRQELARDPSVLD